VLTSLLSLNKLPSACGIHPALAAMLYGFFIDYCDVKARTQTHRAANLKQLRLRFPDIAACRKKIAALLTELSLAHSTSMIKLKIPNMEQLS
jgi:hypothetical protein